jgi:hypothetical protein
VVTPADYFAGPRACLSTVGTPLRGSARRARAAARGLTRGWAARERFAQEGLLAERTISLPRRPAMRHPERDEHSARADMVSAPGLLHLDELARVRRRSERAREQERDAEECA